MTVMGTGRTGYHRGRPVGLRGADLRPEGAPGPERVLDDQVRELARYLGWERFHAYDARRSPEGFPDLVLVRPPRVLLVELKSPTGKLTPAQQRWQELLGECPGVEVYTWRPADLDGIARLMERPGAGCLPLTAAGRRATPKATT